MNIRRRGVQAGLSIAKEQGMASEIYEAKWLKFSKRIFALRLKRKT
jgi:hypothetical protein